MMCRTSIRLITGAETKAQIAKHDQLATQQQKVLGVRFLQVVHPTNLPGTGTHVRGDI